MICSRPVTSYGAQQPGYRLAALLRRLVPSVLALLWLAGVPAIYAGQAAPLAKSHADASSAQGQNDKASPVLTEDSEVKLGRENAEENDKHVKLVTDAALVERVNRIGRTIAAVANSVPIPPLWGTAQLKHFNYTFKIVDDKDVNAYSLPGGFIYVNKGLLDYVHSDDELAGVLAHEISHAAHHHIMKLLNEQNKINGQTLLLKIAAAALMFMGHGNNAADAQNIFLATQLYTVAKTNGYGVEAEKDADHTGMLLLTHTHYSPVGLYSFMRRLAVDERNHTYGDLGIFRTHPPGEERAEAAKELLGQLHIPIRLTEVDPTRRATVTLAKDGAGGGQLAEIKIHSIVVCRVAADEGLTAAQRAEKIAARLNGLIDNRLQPVDIRVNHDQTCVLVRGQPLLTEADATAQNKSIPALAHEMADAVLQINEQESLEGP